MLRHEGYELIFDPTATALIGYSTVHRDRTWEQVKSGVPSRVGKKAQAAEAMRAWNEERESSTALSAPGALLDSLDPSRISVSPRAAATWDKWEHGADPLGRNEQRANAPLRESLADAHRGGEVSARSDGLWELVARGRRWLITADGLGLVALAAVQPVAPQAEGLMDTGVS